MIFLVTMLLATMAIVLCVTLTSEVEQSSTAVSTTSCSSTTTSAPIQPPVILILTTSFLPLNTYQRHAMISDPSGSYINDETDFEFDPDATIHYSCSFSWRDRHFIVGGFHPNQIEITPALDAMRQVSQVVGCALAHVGELNFSAPGPACTVMGSLIYICFHMWHSFPRIPKKTCYVGTTPFDKFDMIEEKSHYGHGGTQIANSGSKYRSVCVIVNKLKSTYSPSAREYRGQRLVIMSMPRGNGSMAKSGR